MIRSMHVLAGLFAVAATSASAAGFIEAAPKNSAGYKAAAAVAASGCQVKASEWANLVLDHGGVAGDAVAVLRQMRENNEIAIDNATQSFKLVGVLGC